MKENSDDSTHEINEKKEKEKEEETNNNEIEIENSQSEQTVINKK